MCQLDDWFGCGLLYLWLLVAASPLYAPLIWPRLVSPRLLNTKGQWGIVDVGIFKSCVWLGVILMLGVAMKERDSGLLVFPLAAAAGVALAAIVAIGAHLVYRRQRSLNLRSD